MEFVAIISTIDNKHNAQTIADHLISNHLAACVTILPAIESVFFWNNRQCHEKEILLLIKSTVQKEQEIINVLQEIHPYDIPEIISLPIRKGSKKYLDWIAQYVSAGD